MCGIIGYTGAKDTLKILIDGLKTLEYRGYDSAGVAFFTESGLQTVKSKGKLSALAEKLNGMNPASAEKCTAAILARMEDVYEMLNAVRPAVSRVTLKLKAK